MSNWCLSGGGAASYQASLISMESRFFGACDSSTIYPLRGSPYFAKQTTSARPAERNVGIVAGILMSLTEDFQGSGRNVICDNYFTDLKLAESLAKTKLTMIGTIKRNKTFLPLDFQEKKAIPLGESKFLFRNKTTLLSYQNKRPKNVLLLSTMHSKAEIVAEKNNKPEMVLAYNKTKGGVDAMDQMAHAFTTKRKTQRWHMVIFFNMLDLVSIASRVVFMLKFPLSPLPHEDNRQVQPGHRAITCSSPDHASCCCPYTSRACPTKQHQRSPFPPAYT
ncbi:hypothetical protein RRG08_013264 [Elysia crispata]|uniref:PiggyBac transposable element-derived protein domain-containing protein n=1 Tax=Elysia crispata TaxID=231223 RepID=A0AAE0Z9W4_9GAST|nr:hypothetical protein RRG08_013264 [Elysia crispata]